MNLSDITEAFRKSMVDVLVPEIRLLREETNKNFAKIDDRFTKMDERFTKMDERFNIMQKTMEERFTKMDERFNIMDERFNIMQKTMDERFTRMDERFNKMDNHFEKLFEVVLENKVDVKELKAKQQMNEILFHLYHRLEGDVEKIKLKLAA